MKRSYVTLCLLYVLGGNTAFASACGAWVGKQEAACHCSEKELQYVKASKPKGVALQAVCDLRSANGSEIDLKRQSVVMDRDDEVLLGSFYVKGSLVLSGVVQIIPDSDVGAGFLLFNADPSIENSGSWLGRNLRAFKMYKPEHYKRLRVTTKMRSGECRSARATIKLEDPVVVMAETDAAGTYPSRISVLHLGPYKPCSSK